MNYGKKLFFLMFVCVLSISLLLVSSGAALAAAFPTKPVTLIVPYPPGGGSDIGARLLSVEAEKILGQPISIVNQPGAGGWIGWTALLNTKADGYTIAHINTPNVITGYVDPQQKRDKTLDNFAPILCFCIDDGILAINPKETRFTDMKSLIAFAQKNEVTAAVTGAASDDDILLKTLNKELNTKFVPVISRGAAETIPAVMGGHVDILIANVGEVKNPAANGDLKPIAVTALERTPIMPDVPTVKELTGAAVVGASARGLAAPAGTDPAVLKVLIDAFSKAAQVQSFRDKMMGQGLNVVAIAGDDYMKKMKEEEANVKSLAPLFGW